MRDWKKIKAQELKDGSAYLKYDSTTNSWDSNPSISGSGSGGAQSVTYVVAASTSRNKSLADYICDGTDDDVQIQQAIDALPSEGGKIVLLEGVYRIGSTINMNKNRTYIIGQGIDNTRVKLQASANCDIFLIEGTGNNYFNTLRDMAIDGNKASNTAGSGIVVNELDTHLDNLFVESCSDEGIEVLCSWGFVANDLIIEFGESDGLYINHSGGTEAKVTNCKIAGNTGSAIKTTGTFGKFIGNYLNTSTASEYIIDIQGNYNIFSSNILTSSDATDVKSIGVHLDGSFNRLSNNVIYGGNTVDGMTKAYVIESGKSGNVCNDLIYVYPSDWLTNSSTAENLIISKEGSIAGGVYKFLNRSGYKYERETASGGALKLIEYRGKKDTAIGYNDGIYSLFVYEDNSTTYNLGQFLFRNQGGTIAQFAGRVYYDSSHYYEFMSAKPDTSISMAVTDISAGRLKTASRVIDTTTVNSSTYTLLDTDYLLHVTYTSTGACTITLPTAQTVDGRIIKIKDAGNNADNNNITINTQGSEKIEFNTNLVINTKGMSYDLYSDGTDWFIL